MKSPKASPSLENIVVNSLIGKVYGQLPLPLRFPFLNTHSAGELRHINKLRYWPLHLVLHQKYLFAADDAEALASFLEPMLRLHPEKRAKAADLIHHRWLDGVIVQGEIDVIRRAEKEEEEGRTGAPPIELSRGAENDGSSHQPRADSSSRVNQEAGTHHKPISDAGGGASLVEAVLTQSDAMKPVGEADSPRSRQPQAVERSPSQSRPPSRLNAPPTPSSAQAKENAASPVMSPTRKGGSKRRG